MNKLNTTRIEKELAIIEKMNDNGYFKKEEEFERALKWLIYNTYPLWFIEDMKKYE